MEDIYFKNDEYWKEHINKKLEEDIWIKNYREYFSGKGKCLDLGCGIGQYSKELMSYGYEVTSADISDIALDKASFNRITRGYYLNGNVVFYKDNFIFDDNLINEALNYLEEISLKVSSSEFEIYFGQLPEENFALDFHYGKYSNGNILKSDLKKK